MPPARTSRRPRRARSQQTTRLTRCGSIPADPIALARIHLALTCLVRGDLADAEAELTHAARRAEQLGFPQGPHTLAYARFVESWRRIEADQLDRAAIVAADLSELAERHGFDVWRLAGATQQASVGGLAALGADDLDPTALSAHIATMTTLLDTVRTFELNALCHLLRRRPRAAVDRRRPTRTGPRPPGHRAGAGPGHRDVLLRRRTATAPCPHPHRPRRSPRRYRRRPRTGPPAGRDPLRTARRPRRFRAPRRGRTCGAGRCGQSFSAGSGSLELERAGAALK